MTRPCPALHCEVFLWVAGVVGSLDLVCVPGVPVVCLYMLALLEIVAEYTFEYFNVSALTHRIRILNPHQIAHKNVNAELI